MARKPTVTAEIVAQAAEAMVERGETPTARKVYGAIGGGCSMGKLNDLLADWKDKQKEREELEQVEIPEEILRHGQELTARLWREAVDLATMGQDAMRKDLLAVREEAKAEQADLFAAIDEIQAKNELLEAGLTAEKQAREALTACSVTADRDLAVMTERAKATTSNLDKMEARRNELEKGILDAHVELAREQSNHARTSEKLKTAEDLILKLEERG